MNKRTLLRLSLIALLGTAGFVAFLLTRPGSPISRANFDKIQVGMTLAEVEAIIGLPPGDDPVRTQPEVGRRLTAQVISR